MQHFTAVAVNIPDKITYVYDSLTHKEAVAGVSAGAGNLYSLDKKRYANLWALASRMHRWGRGCT